MKCMYKVDGFLGKIILGMWDEKMDGWHKYKYIQKDSGNKNDNDCLQQGNT